MTNYDVFNGDTDGIFAWHQLRLAHPREATLVTGVKRDVGLVGRVEAGEDDRMSPMPRTGRMSRDFSIPGLRSNILTIMILGS